jgi:hypothetical protein
VNLRLNDSRSGVASYKHDKNHVPFIQFNHTFAILMKSAVSILFLFSFLLVNLGKSIIFVHYEINKAEITQKYCINKDKPEMHCCGKCMLKKKLAEQEEQQKFPAFPDIKTDIPPIMVNGKWLMVNENTNSQFTIHHSPFTIQYEGAGVFHPPTV